MKRWLPALALAWLVFSTGCTDLDTTYGRPSKPRSVNGNSVLADMFEEAGHDVSSWPWLSPRLQNDADVIVWFPDDFEPPTVDVRRWLESWLIAKPGRTLVYVGRDYDAAPDYWNKVRVGTNGEQYAELSRRLADARADFKLRRGQLPPDEDAEWFKTDGAAARRSVRTLQGSKDWIADIDPARLEIELHSRLVPGVGDEILLESDGDALVTRSEWGDSQLLIVTNGSLFLNLKLINHEHRKLAGHLIDSVGPPPKKVFFLDSSTSKLRIHQEDVQPRMANPLNLVGVKPLNYILWQLAVLGLLFAWGRVPIFGLARQVESPRPGDFGQHVTALGELLEATRDERYALDRLAVYHQTVRHDAPRGRLRADATPPAVIAAPPTTPGAAPPPILAMETPPAESHADLPKPRPSNNT